MNLSSADKKVMAIIAAVVVAFVVIVGGAVAVLTKDTWSGGHPDEDPYLQLAVGDRLVRVEPTRMCDVFLRNCEPEDPTAIDVARVPVPVGESMMLSVSQDIAEWPWNLVVQYLTPSGPDGTIVPMRSNSTYTTVLHSTPDRILIAIEVQLPSVVSAGDDTVSMRGYLAADTSPEGMQLPGSGAALSAPARG
ncbi:DUF2771 family protein [Gordonia sp. Z-3]|uniref:DUF2771 family protein n=1 Tax=unclassified Gordonia (in: high G+C Gram-positive bacteria) TaxID=2657482 RepID=UPI000C59AE78|nr:MULTISPECIES: DUF2771 family protein [unclassified Gordonia (in: high G+C Gram-positive bacteria)]MAU84849.1 hypothetical protein [Gordonia sp. (in: high G+C Gram-positive bacteria)]MED5800053.1 DUF2771 family protein [Gordonia sp. Z-3]